jgi:Brp/Blh family beta-carotene 15,15'-monooxygenase
MTSRYPYLYRIVQGIAALFIFLSILIPSIMEQSQLILAPAFIVLIGIPHGATDYSIFKYLSRPLWGTRQLTLFYINYVIIMLAYSMIWYFLPAIASMIFMLVSIYHFGQSNWNYVSFDNKWESALLFMLWGAFVVFTPIAWHFDSSMAIISSIIGKSVAFTTSLWLQAFCIALFILNIWVSVYLYSHNKLSLAETRDELLNLLILALLFINTPVLLGLAIYLVFWHSMSSVMDQIRFFKIRLKHYSWREYIKNTLPLSLVAIGGLILMGVAQFSMGIPLNVGLVFVFISVATLPNMILIDQLYQELQHA